MDPKTSKIQQKVDQNSQGASKMPPRRPKTRPGRLQEAPNTLPRLPQTYQEAPRRLQKVPQTRPKPLKIWQEARRCQEGFKYHIFPFQFAMKNNKMTSLTSHVDRDYSRDIQKDQMHTGKDFDPSNVNMLLTNNNTDPMPLPVQRNTNAHCIQLWPI